MTTTPAFKSFWIFFLCLFQLILGRPVLAENWEGRELVRTFLLSDSSAIVPGKPFRVGLYLQMLPGWHTYWKNPGDVGLSTAVQWQLPSGFRAGGLQWPLPSRIVLPGGVIDYGYQGDVLLSTEIYPPAHLDAKEIVIRAHASWLSCEKICVPGERNLSLTLPVSTTAVRTNTEVFERFDRQLPAPAPTFPVCISQFPGGIEIRAQPGPDTKKLSFYPLPESNQEIGKVMESPPQENETWWIIKVPVLGKLNGLLVTEDENGNRAGYMLHPSAQLTSPPEKLISKTEEQGASRKFSLADLFQSVLYGLIGGFILNLMPCVFPVISLKIFGFIRQASGERQAIFHHGLAFTAGVFAWFFTLACIVVLVQQSGQKANWAFQFQNPDFNFVILAVVFVFALNLLGVFEIYLPGSATIGLSRLAELQGLWGSFFQGIFATLLATPCTAPFLGAALGFAFSQGGGVIFLIFASVALGLALPYLLLSIHTGWMRMLPRPGVWMERLKQLMAFPLLATAVWLLMVLGGQRGLSSVIAALAFLLSVGFCCWCIGSFGQAGSSVWRHRLVVLASLVTIGVAAFLTWPTRIAGISSSEIAWRPYSKAAVHEALLAGKPVFIDFTADWCLSCKFNEKTAIERPAVAATFRVLGVVAFKADWTNKDPEISEALQAFGRVGVPFYVFYPPGKSVPVILPEILTEPILLKSLSNK